MEELIDRIVIDPKIRHGKPVIKGTRVPIEVVLGSLTGGMSIEDICREYAITREDVLAAVDYDTWLPLSIYCERNNSIPLRFLKISG